MCRAALPALLLWAGAAQAQSPTARSSTPAGDGQVLVGGTLGFPWTEVRATYGLGGWLDAGVSVRSAWGAVQRGGLVARLRLSPPGPAQGLALRAGLDAWWARPAGTLWVDLTGEQDYGGQFALVYSWTTRRGAVLSLDVGAQIVATHKPRPPPLSGPPPGLAFGAHPTVMVVAELPLGAAGPWLAFDLGASMHLSGFDDAFFVPLFGVGVSQAF